MAQLKAIAKSGVVYVTDFFTDPTNIFTAHENIGMVAGSTTTKFTVHYNLFGISDLIQAERLLLYTLKGTNTCFQN